jgi:hypothetical protein
MHRVGRVLNFFPVVGIVTPPSPAFGSGEVAPSLASPNLNSGEGTFTVVLCKYCICTLWGYALLESIQNGRTILLVSQLKSNPVLFYIHDA